MSTDRKLSSQPWLLGSLTRRVRLASGLVLFTYVTLHLLDHSLLNLSVAAADAMLLVQKFVWQGVVGSVLLYGALAVHGGLGLWALYVRRTAGRRWLEGAQLLLGLVFPAMIANHVAVTRLAWSLHGLDKGYIAELTALWVAEPAWGWLQMAVLVVAWAHGCIGLWLLLRLRRWWPVWHPALLAVAMLLPVLALLGFTEGGRAVARALADPAWRAAHLPVSVVGSAAQKAQLAAARLWFLAAYALAIALVLAARAARRVAEGRGGRMEIRYPGGRRVNAPVGLSVLDASRRGAIAHASVCGGKGRCSTCRVRVIWSAGQLPPPAAHELAVLDGIGADAGAVRLACQLYPRGDLAVVPLIPVAVAGDFILGRAPRIPGEERFVAAMFIDLRGSTTLAEQRMPFDSVFLLGGFVNAASRAVTACGGRPVQFLGDGLLALFGLETAPAEACRQALAAVRAAAASLSRLEPLFEQEGRTPLRYGIGLQCGRAVVGEIAFGRELAFTALGETVHVAHRLQELARTHGVAAVVSSEVFALAGEAAPEGTEIETSVRGRAAPLRVRLVPGAW